METEIVSNIPVQKNFITPKIEEDHFIMGDGNLTEAPLMPNGHGWSKYLPIEESQSRNGLETSCCPAYGTIHAMATIGKEKYGISFQSDLSERYLSVLSGMSGSGGDPHEIAGVMRNVGAIPEAFLPFNDSIRTLGQYFSPKPMSYALFKIGFHWLKKYEFGHDWVFFGGGVEQKQAKLKEALKYSPVGVSGYAWSLHSDGKYYHDGPDIHWFEVFDYEENQNGEITSWLAFDSYAPFIKRLEPRYDFGYAKRYSLTKKLGADSIGDTPGSAILPYCKYLLKYYLKISL